MNTINITGSVYNTHKDLGTYLVEFYNHMPSKFLPVILITNIEKDIIPEYILGIPESNISFKNPIKIISVKEIELNKELGAQFIEIMEKYDFHYGLKTYEVTYAPVETKPTTLYEIINS
ncbi:hypothetical protein ACFL13_02535 [Patescibacteria group bacterium]